MARRGFKVTSNRTPLERAMDRAASGALKAAMKTGVAEARSRVPVRSGKLRNSIGERAGKSKARRKLWAFIGAKAPHGRLVEFGTRTMPARPFINPAAEVMRQKYMEIFKRRADKAAARYGGK